MGLFSVNTNMWLIWLVYGQYDFFLNVFKEVSYAHQGCIYLIKNTVKTVIVKY